MRARTRTGVLIALAGLLVGCSSGASPAATSAPETTPTSLPTATADATPAPSPVVTPPTPAAPTASSAAARTLPAEFVGTWIAKTDDPSYGPGFWQFAFNILDGCVLGEACGTFFTGEVPMHFPLVFAHIRGEAVVFDVGESPDEDFRSSGFGSGQTLAPNGDGTLHWSTGDGWSETLYPFSGRLDG